MQREIKTIEWKYAWHVLKIMSVMYGDVAVFTLKYADVNMYEPKNKLSGTKVISSRYIMLFYHSLRYK